MTWIHDPWNIVLIVLAGVAAWLLLAWAHLRFWVARLHLELPYAVAERLRAADGGVYELRRISEEAAVSEDRPPVLLVHGICANHRNQDIHPDYSLARYLANRGRDVWLLTLRSGAHQDRRRGHVPMGFDSMVRHDVPEGIAQVLARTGARALDYVAFSMGGMLLYAALGNTVDGDKLRKVVFVGSPGRVEPPHRVPKVLGRIPRKWTPVLWSGLGARMFAFVSEWFLTPLHWMILNPKNMPKGITRLALVDCVQDVPGELLADFLAWAVNDGVVRVGGKDVLDGIRRARQPALFIAGTADRLGKASAVRAAFDQWGSESGARAKQFALLGQESGAHADYGHGDLAMGSRVTEELYPRIEAFLAQAGDRQISNAMPMDQVEAPTRI